MKKKILNVLLFQSLVGRLLHGHYYSEKLLPDALAEYLISWADVSFY